MKNSKRQYNNVAIHLSFDNRLSIPNFKLSSTIKDGDAISNWEKMGAIKENDNAFLLSASVDDKKFYDGVLCTFPLTLPNDCKPGDIFPIEIKYDPQGENHFCNDCKNNEEGQLMEAWLFTKGIIHGYIKIKDDTVTTTSLSTITTTTTSTTTTTTTTSSKTTTMTTTTTTVPNQNQQNYSLGDINNDGQINSVDASSILAYYAKISTNKDGGFNDAQIIAADVDNDGQVNAVDASNILAYYAYVSTTQEDVRSLKEFMKK